MDLIDFNSSEDEPPVNFFLSSLEEQIHVELKDSDARLTQSKSEGRVLLEIQEDLLANFLDGLQERREDVKCKPEHQCLQQEICSLKAQLTKSVSEVKFLNNKLTKICPMLRNAQKDLVEQTSTITNQQIAFESMKADKEALQSELQIIKPMVGLYKTNVELSWRVFLNWRKRRPGRSQQPSKRRKISWRMSASDSSKRSTPSRIS
ncbi:hypothetical protein PBY51_021652 [Eleginops maclovinus]|uniref:Uncharacterized protein n=1 Tax=Eleginops maclovinus TaxID=56733 RepID=A0AAN7XIB4_ELEMC|nr:hypothetical protein PBY51_021652 [Eleginops maclovinus]